MAAFMKFDGVDGESKDKDHKTWIDVLSLDKGVHKPGGGATGQTRRRGSGGRGRPDGHDGVRKVFAQVAGGHS